MNELVLLGLAIFAAGIFVVVLIRYIRSRNRYKATLKRLTEIQKQIDRIEVYAKEDDSLPEVIERTNRIRVKLVEAVEPAKKPKIQFSIKQLNPLEAIEQPTEVNKQDKKTKDIVDILLDDKRTAVINSVRVLLIFLSIIAVAVAVIISGQSDFNFSSSFSAGFVVLLFGFGIVALTNLYVFGYRVKHGLYGTTRYEVQEIIEFIIKHSDKTDFSGPSGINKLMPELETKTNTVPDGAVA